ncbi:fimbrillin family protein [Phocaeicola sp.]
MKKQIRVIGIWAVCTTAALCGCSQNEELDEANQLVDLCVKTSSITLTRAAGTTGTKVITSDYFDANSVIAVYAHSSNTNKTSNNHAKFKCSAATAKDNNTWGYDGSDKIQLSAEVATIYAVYPDGLTVTTNSGEGVTGDNLKASGVQVFVGSGTDDENSRIVADQTYTSDPPILAAPGETDYMYATDGKSGAQTNAQPKANNGKASDTSSADNNPGNSISLQMNHAMAMVSFKVYNDGTYTHEGKLTKIQLTNADTYSLLKLGAMTMNISDGTMAEASATPANDATSTPTAITRYIYTKGESNNTAGYTLHQTASGGTGSPDNNPAFSMLVYPITSAITQNSIKAIFTVDGNDYPVTIPAGSSQTWAAGNNYIYTVKLNGKELAITNVTIKQWQSGTVNDGELVPVS